MFLDSLSLTEQVVGLENPNGCRALENIAYYYYQRKGDAPMAMTYLRRALFMYRSVFGRDFWKSNEIRCGAEAC